MQRGYILGTYTASPCIDCTVRLVVAMHHLRVSCDMSQASDCYMSVVKES